MSLAVMGSTRPDRVAGGDSPERLQARKEGWQVDAFERLRADDVLLDRLVERNAERAQQRIEHCAIDERRTVVFDQSLSRRGMAPRGLGAVREVALARRAQRSAQLLVVVLVGERRVLVEPLRREQLGCGAFGFAAISVRIRQRTNACGDSVSVTTPKRNGMRSRTSRSRKSSASILSLTEPSARSMI
jgi:hypothetical protein